jgi:heme-degrading monooxygenase HmoA
LVDTSTRVIGQEATMKIEANDRLITFINVFEVLPEDQARVVALLTEVTNAHVTRQRGFVSCALHRSMDGTKVAMYAQWRSLEDYEAMRSVPGPAAALNEIMRLASLTSDRYEVSATFDHVDL